jgi:hypothetical protein
MRVAGQPYKIFFFLQIIIFPFVSKAATGEPVIDSVPEFGNKKEIPKQFEKPILTALSYFPELKDVRIVFKIKKAYTPLTTRPNFAGVFKRRNHRTYIITISDQSIDTLKPLLFQNLTFEQQVGVIGHELSHVVDFNSKNFLQTIGVGIGHISKGYLDKMEFNTDGICIQHGLGKYLLAYSKHVRETMHVHNWRGGDFVNKGNGNGKYERYMNPDTIEKTMLEMQSH